MNKTWSKLMATAIRNTQIENRAIDDDGNVLTLPEGGVNNLLQLARIIESDAQLHAFTEVVDQSRPVAEEDMKLLVAAAAIATGNTNAKISKQIKAFERQRKSKERKEQKEQERIQKKQAKTRPLTECFESVGIESVPLWVQTLEDKDGCTLIPHTIENTNALCEAMGLNIGLNEMTKEQIVYGGVISDKHDMDAICTRVASASLIARYSIPEKTVFNHLRVLALEKAHHPVKDWLEGDKWDGRDRIQELSDTLISDMDTELKQAMLRKWLVTAIAMIYSPAPIAAQGVLVLQGGQGKGKTTWVKSLCPVDRAVATGITLDVTNVDSIRAATNCWIGELGELDSTFKKSDIARLKAFITDEYTTYRTPFSFAPVRHRRSSVYAATVNPKTFTTDPTGNRRYWVIPVTDIKENTVNMRQLWLQVKSIFMSGEEPLYLSHRESAMINEHNKQFEQMNDFEVAITDLYGKTADYPAECIGNKLLKTKEIYEAVINETSTTNTLTMNDKRAIQSALVANGWEHKRGKRNNTWGQYWHLCKPVD